MRIICIFWQVELTAGTSQSADVYRQPFGIRTIKVTDKKLFINGEMFYCHGVAKHEDSDVWFVLLSNNVTYKDPDSYSPTILENILCPVLQILLYLAAFECNTTSDWLTHTG